MVEAIATQAAQAAGAAQPAPAPAPAPSGFTGTVHVDDGSGAIQALTFANGLLKTVA
jgi:hypothetical protein